MIANISAANIEPTDFVSADELSIEQNMRYLEWLLQWYCREPSLQLATIIVSRLEWLREQQEKDASATREWSCSRMIRSWETIAKGADS